jgi:glycopeptide antibiotics resistance protein
MTVAFARWRSGRVLVPLGFLLLAAYSLAIEETQLHVARIDRACDVTDIIDNVTGAAVGVALALLLLPALRPWRGRGRPRPEIG